MATMTEAPVAPPQSIAQAPSFPTVNVNSLGLFIDGWGDIIEDQGARTLEIQDEVYTFLANRHMPEVHINRIKGMVGLLAFDRSKRNYIITATYPGATTTIYISPHGKDLYVSWATYVKAMVNLKLLLLLTVLALIPGTCLGVSGLIGPVAGLGSESSDAASLGLQAIGSLFLLLCCGGSIFVTTLMSLGFEVLAVGFISYLTRGNPIAMFLVEPTVFDADDIAAMSLSVHKSILKALDKVRLM